LPQAHLRVENPVLFFFKRVMGCKVALFLWPLAQLWGVKQAPSRLLLVLPPQVQVVR
jgi:hypothetical protein